MKLCESWLNLVPVYSLCSSALSDLHANWQFANLHANRSVLNVRYVLNWAWTCWGGSQKRQQKSTWKRDYIKATEGDLCHEVFGCRDFNSTRTPTWAWPLINDHSERPRPHKTAYIFILPWTTARPVYTKDPKISKVDYFQRVHFTTHFRWKIAGIWSPWELRLTVPQFREFLACGYGTPPALLALMQYLGSCWTSMCLYDLRIAILVIDDPHTKQTWLVPFSMIELVADHTGSIIILYKPIL